MNKKSLLMMMVTICLIAVVGVGATLAYLSDATGELTNKFEFVEKGIDITLDEAEIVDNLPTGERIEAGENKGNIYSDLIPGMVMVKDPRVTVEAESVDCYVVVRIENPNKENVLKINGVDAEGKAVTFGNDVWAYDTWEDVTPENNTNESIKYYAYKNKVVKSSDPQSLNVFGTVTFVDTFEPEMDSEGTVKTTISDIIIKAAAVQANEIDKIVAIEKAIEMLNN